MGEGGVAGGGAGGRLLRRVVCSLAGDEGRSRELAHSHPTPRDEPSVLTIAPNGLLHALASGKVIITVSGAQLTRAIPVEVVALATNPGPPLSIEEHPTAVNENDESVVVLGDLDRSISINMVDQFVPLFFENSKATSIASINALTLIGLVR